MSRWDNLPSSNQFPDEQPYADFDQSNTVVKTGDTFIRSRNDGENSDFVRCFYENKNGNGIYEIICDKTPGCCTDGCCPKDTLMMEGLYVLIAFVIIIAIVALVLLIVCASRSKYKQKKEQNIIYSQNNESQIGIPVPDYQTSGYTTYMGPSTKY